MPKPSSTYPKRGDIFIANLDPAFGREIHKKRPILVISNNTLNQTLPTVVMIPFSSIIPQFIGPDVIKISALKSTLDKESVLITNQIRAIHKERLVKKIGRLSQNLLEEVEQALKITLGFNNG